MNGYRINAYAKVNLGLDVVRRLPNGYHQVKMVMQSVGIHDELTMEKAEEGMILTTDSEYLVTIFTLRGLIWILADIILIFYLK